MRKRVVFFLWWFVLLCIANAFAGFEINLKADSITVNRSTFETVATGNVEITFREVVLSGNCANIFFDRNGNILMMKIKGGFIMKKVNGDTVVGDFAVYDSVNKLLKMTGNVMSKIGNNTVSSNEIIYQFR